jgi:hypothetical protein
MEKNYAHMMSALEVATEWNNAAIEAQGKTADMVARAVANGASWSAVGEALGLSKQTAYARYAKEAKLYADQQKWEADNPEKAEAAREKGRAAAAKDIEEIRNRNTQAKNSEPKPKTTKKPSKKSDVPAPAKVTQASIRPEFVLQNAAMLDGRAAPGTGKGPHQCPRCGTNNHKSGKPNTYVAYLDCVPTKYDPQDITDMLNRTGLRAR